MSCRGGVKRRTGEKASKEMWMFFLLLLLWSPFLKMGLPANEIEKAWIDDKDTAGILRMQYYIYFFISIRFGCRSIFSWTSSPRLQQTKQEINAAVVQLHFSELLQKVMAAHCCCLTSRVHIMTIGPDSVLSFNKCLYFSPKLLTECAVFYDGVFDTGCLWILTLNVYEVLS